MIKSVPPVKNSEPTEADRLQRNLLIWYETHSRNLPWRQTNDPYSIWVSEVMLQQTQVKTVIPYYQNFMRKFPTVSALSASSLEAVLLAWQGMGYYARARNLHRAAKILQERYSGEIPSDYARFRALPGVGDYIAAAVLSIAFGQPLPVLDGNVKRVLSRLFLLEEFVNDPKERAAFLQRAETLFYPADPGRFNQALMELGALVCRPNQPLCAECPLAKYCAAAIQSLQKSYPRKKAPRTKPFYQVAVGVVKKDSRLLLTRRRTEGLLGGLWEFPGGKIEKNESAVNACLREIREEVNLCVGIQKKIATLSHEYTHFKIRLHVFLCFYRSGRVRLHGPQAHRWIRFSQLRKFPLPAANLKFLPALEKALEFDRNKPFSAESG